MRNRRSPNTPRFIEQLQSRGLIQPVSTGRELIGYRFVGELHRALESLDSALVAQMRRMIPLTSHSSTASIPRAVLEAIGFFEKLPSIPFFATPHGAATTSGDWVLSPSTCYHTFSLLAGTEGDWELKAFTSVGQCHRYEPEEGEFTRLGNFTMREFVLIGAQSRVEQTAELLLEAALDLIRRAGGRARLQKASDVFYGERSEATRKVQLALGVKIEILLRSPTGEEVSVGSRNLHRQVFTTNFGIGAGAGNRMHSACVAFGLERLLLLLLAECDDFDALQLLERLEGSADLLTQSSPGSP